LENNEVKGEKILVINMSSSPPKASIHSENIAQNSDELPKRILVPLDGSNFSFRAAKYAINLAKLTGGEIMCIHAVADLSYIEYMGPGILTVTRYIDEAKKTDRGVVFKSKSNGSKRRRQGKSRRYNFQSSISS
jgi:hypothetical protein